MEGNPIWELFRDTGSPEAYLLYRRYCRHMEREQEFASRQREVSQ